MPPCLSFSSLSYLLWNASHAAGRPPRVSRALLCSGNCVSCHFLVCFHHYYYYQNGGGNDSTKLHDTLAENATYSSTMYYYYFFFFNANIHTTQQGNQCCNNVDRRCACYWNQFPCCRINSIQCFCKKKKRFPKSFTIWLYLGRRNCHHSFFCRWDINL